MSTRACVGTKLDNGTYLMNYVHYDGYPNHLGEILTHHFDSYEKACELLDLPHIRAINEDGSLDLFPDGEAEIHWTIEDALKGFNYCYVFLECWKCYSRELIGLREYDLYDHA